MVLDKNCSVMMSVMKKMYKKRKNNGMLPLGIED